MFFQVEAWFLSAAHHFPWTYAFGEENSALLYLNLFCLDPPARNSNKNCQIVTIAGFLSVALAAFTSVELCAWSWGWALSSTAGGPACASPVITGRKSLKLLPRLPVLAVRQLPQTGRATGCHIPCLLHYLALLGQFFQLQLLIRLWVIELWSYGIDHSSISACPALPASIPFCLDAAEEEWDLLLSRLGESHSLILTKQSGYGLVCISIPAFAGT